MDSRTDYRDNRPVALLLVVPDTGLDTLRTQLIERTIHTVALVVAKELNIGKTWFCIMS